MGCLVVDSFLFWRKITLPRSLLLMLPVLLRVGGEAGKDPEEHSWDVGTAEEDAGGVAGDVEGDVAGGVDGDVDGKLDK